MDYSGQYVHTDNPNRTSFGTLIVTPRIDGQYDLRWGSNGGHQIVSDQQLQHAQKTGLIRKLHPARIRVPDGL